MVASVVARKNPGASSRPRTLAKVSPSGPFRGRIRTGPSSGFPQPNGPESRAEASPRGLGNCSIPASRTLLTAAPEAASNTATASLTRLGGRFRTEDAGMKTGRRRRPGGEFTGKFLDSTEPSGIRTRT